MAKWLFPSMSFKLPRRLIRTPRQRQDSLAESHGSSSSESIGSGGGQRDQSQFQRVFEQFDINSDGKVSAEEVRTVLLATSPAGEEVAREAVEGVIGGEGMGYEDFVRMMEGGRGADDEGEEVERELRLAFEVLAGEDQKGITAGGLRRVLEGLGDARTHEECRRMIRAYDVDGNGAIDYQEFRRMMTAVCA